MNKVIETFYRFPIDQHKVNVVYIEYAGGGECWEFSVFFGVTDNFDITEWRKLHTSENGYGNPASAASDGFKWIVDNSWGYQPPANADGWVSPVFGVFDGSDSSEPNIIQDVGS